MMQTPNYPSICCSENCLKQLEFLAKDLSQRLEQENLTIQTIKSIEFNLSDRRVKINCTDPITAQSATETAVKLCGVAFEINVGSALYSKS